MKLHPGLGLCILLAIVAYPLFGNIGYYPIRLWDESRVAINAWEMYKSGDWIVTSFNGQPDMWNTKPPLLTWIQALSLHVFGPGDMPIRMVSPVAGLFTCIFLYWFFLKKFKQPWLGILVCLVLVTSKGYIRMHGTRTGEYDALLVMFTTMYALYYFLYLEDNNKKYFYTAVATLILAALTKGIAALMFLPALFLFTIVQKKALPLLRSRHFYISILLFLFFVAGFYLLREHYNPGFIKQVQINEFGGRYAESDGQDSKYNNDVLYYYRFLRGNTFIRWLVLMYAGVILGLMAKDRLLRRLSLYSILAGWSYFIIVSFGSTKNEWYDMAAYPFFAIITAVGIYILCGLLMKIPFKKRYFNYSIVTGLIILVSWLPYSEIIQEIRNPVSQDWSLENDSITFYVKDIYGKNKKTDDMAVAYTGYQADLEWYRLLLAEDGRKMDTVNYHALPAGKKIIAYQKDVKEYIAANYASRIVDTFKALNVSYINGAKQ